MPNITRFAILGFTTAGFAVLAWLAAAGVANAAPRTAGEAPPGLTALPVDYGDLDLASPAGANAMAQRLREAAAKTCWATDPASVFGDQRAACVRATLAVAVQQLASPAVSDALGIGPDDIRSANGVLH